MMLFFLLSISGMFLLSYNLSQRPRVAYTFCICESVIHIPVFCIINQLKFFFGISLTLLEYKLR